MKRLMMLIAFMFSAAILFPQNPLPWNEGNFPTTMYYLTKADNGWLQSGDSIYSAFKVNDQYYASGVKVSSSTQVFIMAFNNAGTDVVQVSDDDYITIPGFGQDIPVKTGFDFNEQVYWGVCRDGVIKKLTFVNSYPGPAGTSGIFINSDTLMTILDNPYWSLNPVWPSNLNYRLKMPDTLQRRALQRDFFLYNLAYSSGADWRMQLPKYLKAGSLKWEMVDGKSKVTNDRKGFLNQAKFRLAIEDLRRGYMMVKLTGVQFPNSDSEDLSRIYRIYFH